jgi:type IV secretory pathway VirD2 relaxase
MSSEETRALKRKADATEDPDYTFDTDLNRSKEDDHQFRRTVNEGMQVFVDSVVYNRLQSFAGLPDFFR